MNFGGTLILVYHLFWHFLLFFDAFSIYVLDIMMGKIYNNKAKYVTLGPTIIKEVKYGYSKLVKPQA